MKAALETLIATGTSAQAKQHGNDWLQRSVDDAVSRGDQEIERLAIRASVALTARITRPVSSTADLPSLQLDSRTVLKVRQSIPYAARIEASLDGRPLVLLGDVESGKGRSFSFAGGLAAGALPGAHHLRVRAELTFGDPWRPMWTEVRDLPELFYAIYDENRALPSDARPFVFGPTRFSAHDFDPLLPPQPIGVWLDELLAPRRLSTDPAPSLVSHYCSERTEDPRAPYDPRAICSVLYFAAGELGQIWFRTGTIKVREDRIDWILHTPPTIEAIILSESAPESPRLAMLPSLLATPTGLRPTADVTIAPRDIVITPHLPKPGVPAKAVVTFHNRGESDLHKVLVYVMYGSTPTDRGITRRFVVDIPASKSVDLSVDVVFSRPYGFVLAHAMQLSEHTPMPNPVPDPTPADACAFRVVNDRAAPSGYVWSIGGRAGCIGGR